MSQPDYRERLLASPMSRFQIAAVAMVLALCALDGFDVFAITFAIPAIEREWGVGKTELGMVLSAGLLGMALGSLLVAPLADVWGRRRVLLPSLALVIAGTAWSSLASGPLDLGVSRLVTGIGVGAMIAIINPLAAEYANARRRDLCVTLLNLGFPIGAITGGLLAAWILPQFGWRALFLWATALGAILLLLSIRWLVEPIASLLARPSADAYQRANAYLRLCRQPPLEALPAPIVGERKASALSLLGKPEMAVVTAHVMAVYFLYVVSLFYIQSWIPSMVVSAGFPASEAAHVSVWMNLGGIVGGLVLGTLSDRLGLKACVAIAFVAGAMTIGAFGLIPVRMDLFMATGAILGFFTIGGMAGLYAVVSRSFPAEARASGTGLVIGVGRLGSAIAPTIAGMLFAVGFGRSYVSIVMAVPALIAAALLLALRLRQS